MSTTRFKDFNSLLTPNSVGSFADVRRPETEQKKEVSPKSPQSVNTTSYKDSFEVVALDGFDSLVRGRS